MLILRLAHVSLKTKPQLYIDNRLVKIQEYDYVFVPEKGDKGEWVSWMSTAEKYVIDPKLQFNEVGHVLVVFSTMISLFVVVVAVVVVELSY